MSQPPRPGAGDAKPGASGPDAAKPDRDATVDAREVARFDAMASQWWDPSGAFAPLHALNPTRLAYVSDTLRAHFGGIEGGITPFKGVNILDIGCGGGLLAEPLARLGAAVTGIDPAPESIAAARAHAGLQGLDIAYECARAEDLAAAGRTFDAVTALEVVEHVPDVPAFVALCARLVRPGGVLVLSTLNRTLKAYALAIVGAEYVLRWLPVGTHDWNRFVTPDELARACGGAGLAFGRLKGMVYNPLRDEWRLSDDTDVNYLASATRPGPAEQGR